MKTKTIFFRLNLLFAFTLALSSCKVMTEGFGGTYHYDKVHPLASYSILKDGYWGEWKKVYREYQYSFSEKYDYRVQTHYISLQKEILMRGIMLSNLI
ncbi:hypothetical protein EZS27_021774 [termite gut metagenome]|uniref:Lipoprotein n=1 Tax=termite gut metagenome TaxID=433724 RepID=A0A5J4R8Q6_9ZZZZ